MAFAHAHVLPDFTLAPFCEATKFPVASLRTFHLCRCISTTETPSETFACFDRSCEFGLELLLFFYLWSQYELRECAYCTVMFIVSAVTVRLFLHSSVRLGVIANACVRVCVFNGGRDYGCVVVESWRTHTI